MIEKNQSGGDGKNTTKARNLSIRHSQWLFTSSFFSELKHSGKHFLMTYVYFLTSLKYALKLLVEGLFFNELELCDNIARQSYDNKCLIQDAILKWLISLKLYHGSFLYAS